LEDFRKANLIAITERGGMDKALRWYDYLTLNVYNLGLSTLSQTVAPLVLPLLVQAFVGESQKATYYGNLRLWGLMVAILAQVLLGLLSDRSQSRWGRRRPFILGGTLADLVFIAAIGLCGTVGLSDLEGYWLLFAAYVLLQISFNAGQGAAQGLIPDNVPENHLGRASAIKAVLEVPLPVILVSFAVAPLIGGNNYWGGLLVAAVVLTLTMVLAMFIRETPLAGRLAALDWKPFLRILLMTAAFTVIILGMGEVIRQFESLLGGIGSMTTLFLVLGLVGLVAMMVAVVLGVWLCIRIGAGSGAGKSFTAWVISRLAFMVGVFNLSSFAVYFLQARLNLVKEQAAQPAANLLVFVGVAVLIFALAGGWLADRFARRTLVAVSGGLATFGTLIAILSPTLPLIYVGGMVIGAATGLFYTANWALGTLLVPKAEAGRFLGISNLAGAGAGAVGAYIGGPIADYFTVHFPEAPGLGYVLLFAIYGVLFLLSIVTLRWVDEPAKSG
jgi:MFS family permease